MLSTCKFNQHSSILCFTFLDSYIQNLCVGVYMWVWVFSKCLTFPTTPVTWEKNVKYEQMSQTEPSELRIPADLCHGWACVVQKHQTSHLGVTFLVSWQSGWEYFVTLHQELVCLISSSAFLSFFPFLGGYTVWLVGS